VTLTNVQKVISDATWRKREQREREAAAVIALRYTFFLQTLDGCAIRRLKLWGNAAKARAEIEAQLHRWQLNASHYIADELVVALEEEPFEPLIECGTPKRFDKAYLRDWSKVVYGAGLHRRGWRDNESGTDNETGNVGLAEEINKPLDSHRVGRTERAIGKIDKPVDYDDDESIGNDRAATIEAARLNKRLAKKIAKERRVIEVGKDDGDAPDISVYGLKTEGSRRFGDDTEVTVRDVVTVTAGEAPDELDIEDNGILNALERNQDRAISLVSEYSGQAARPRR
jgi:hypothetical protein